MNEEMKKISEGQLLILARLTRKMSQWYSCEAEVDAKTMADD